MNPEFFTSVENEDFMTRYYQPLNRVTRRKCCAPKICHLSEHPGYWDPICIRTLHNPEHDSKMQVRIFKDVFFYNLTEIRSTLHARFCTLEIMTLSMRL